ncbi:MAG: hypothetical protein KDI46_04065 [Alphaproteobacteria bacterium]|nr:hypothetical protein [Alphaproteobacteria bacterium]
MLPRQIQIKELSEQGPIQALDKALIKAVSFAKGSPHTDIFLSKIQNTDKGWQAHLHVISSSKHKKSPLNDEIMAETIKNRKEKEEKEQKERQRHYKHEREEADHEQQMQKMEYDRTLLDEEEEIVILYAELLYEEIVLGVPSRYDLTAIHFEPEGTALLEAAKTRYPDLEFYDAASEPLTGEQRDTGEKKRKPKLALKEDRTLSPEATAE